jgi:hypothetical protein
MYDGRVGIIVVPRGRIMRRIVSVGVAVALVAAACTTGSGPSTSSTAPPGTVTSTSAPTTTSTSTTLPTPTTTVPAVVPAAAGGFAGELIDVPLITEGTYGGPAWPTSLSGVAFADAVPEALRADLVRNGFVIEPNVDTYDDWGVEELSWKTQFSTLYDQLSPYGERAIFVTTDTAYHLWHQVFDLVLRETESEQLLPVLDRLVASLVEASRAQASGAADPVVAEAALRAQEHLEAVATVLGLGVGGIGERAAAEAALVEQATEYVPSPTVGGTCLPPTASCVDYSLSKPRGHYTRTEELTRYFKAMSMLGGTGFSVTDVDTLRVGLLIARLIVTDEERAQDWATIYHPTAFLVGAADDYIPSEAATAAESIGAGLADVEALSSDDTVGAIGTELLGMRPVQIDPGLASLRTMGARFVLDSWLYDQLTDPGVANRIRPTPLDFASVMGSAYAAATMEASGEDAAFPDYRSRITELEEAVSSRTVEDWGKTVYDAWLYALEPMWGEQAEGAFPPFMRGEAWDAKSHNTGFSSYTELKHDTILYAKQAIAEGEADVPPPPPRHWIEPDPVAFGRLLAVTRMMRDGLISAELMIGDDFDFDTADATMEGPDRTRWITEALIRILEPLERIARDELDGTSISDEDNEWLSYFGGRVGGLLNRIGNWSLDPSPLVADIFLDPFADEVLELGTGPLDTIHVLVPDDRGGFEVATGVVYSYHEFWGPRSERLSDEEWWDRIIAGDLPDRPQWWLDEHG